MKSPLSVLNLFFIYLLISISFFLFLCLSLSCSACLCLCLSVCLSIFSPLFMFNRRIRISLFFSLFLSFFLRGTVSSKVNKEKSPKRGYPSASHLNLTIYVNLMVMNMSSFLYLSPPLSF